MTVDDEFEYVDDERVKAFLSNLSEEKKLYYQNLDDDKWKYFITVLIAGLDNIEFIQERNQEIDRMKKEEQDDRRQKWRTTHQYMADILIAENKYTSYDIFDKVDAIRTDGVNPVLMRTVNRCFHTLAFLSRVYIENMTKLTTTGARFVKISDPTHHSEKEHQCFIPPDTPILMGETWGYADMVYQITYLHNTNRFSFRVLRIEEVDIHMNDIFKAVKFDDFDLEDIAHD